MRGKLKDVSLQCRRLVRERKLALSIVCRAAMFDFGNSGQVGGG